MPKSVLDPAPRSYPDIVYLLARSSRGASCAPKFQTISDISDWLLHDAAKIDDVVLMFEEFMWRCRAAGIPVERSTLHIGTLHPPRGWLFMGLELARRNL